MRFQQIFFAPEFLEAADRRPVDPGLGESRSDWWASETVGGVNELLVKSRLTGEDQTESWTEIATDRFIDDPEGVERTISVLEREAEKGPDEALAAFGMTERLTAIVNSVATRIPELPTATSTRLVGRLQTTIKQLHGLLSKIKQSLSALSFTITVGVPFVIQVGITF